MRFAIAIIAGLACGMLTGAGIGGGTLLVLYLTALGGVEQNIAGGINLLFFLVTAPPALYSHIKNKLVQCKSGAFAAAAGAVTAFASACLARNMDNAVLRKIFGVLFIIVGINQLFSKKKSED